MPRRVFANRAIGTSRVFITAALGGVAGVGEGLADNYGWVDWRRNVRPTWTSGFAKHRGQAHTDLDVGLKAGWVPALGVAGSRIPDVIGRADATVTGQAPAWLPSTHGTTFTMDAAGGYGLIPAGTQLDDLVTGFCVALYWKPNGPTLNHLDERGFFIKKNAAGTDVIQFYIDGSEPNLYLRLFPIGGGASQIVFQDVGASPGIDIANKWTHAVASWSTEDNTLRLYINGVLRNTRVAGLSGGIDNGAGAATCFGRETNPERFFGDGAFHSMFVWDRALSASQVRKLYRDPLAPVRPRRRVPVLSANIPDYGLVCMSAAEVYQPGITAAAAYQAGPSEVEVYSPGFDKLIAGCC